MNQINKKFQEIEVTYQNKSANITLSGTLTIPEKTGPCPAVLLIPGMGPVDRDGTTYYGHKPSLAIANYLTQNGIAVLRFDKRGTGKSTGTFDLNVTAHDLTQDAQAGINYLKSCPEINPSQIGLIGHSEGGLIATIVAANSNDIAWIILLSGAIVHSTDGLIEQVAVQLHADGASDAMIEYDKIIRTQILNLLKHNKNPQDTITQMHTIFASYWAQLPDDLKAESTKLSWAFSQANKDTLFNFMNSDYYRFMITHDSSKDLSQIKIPLLALCGELDFMAPHTVFPVINQAMALSGNKDYTTLELSKLNHSFQTCTTGAMAEYATIKETISPIALDVMTQWILQHTTGK